MPHPLSRVQCGGHAVSVKATLIDALGLESSGTLEPEDVQPLLRDLDLLAESVKIGNCAQRLKKLITDNYPNNITWD